MFVHCVSMGWTSFPESFPMAWILATQYHDCLECLRCPTRAKGDGSRGRWLPSAQSKTNPCMPQGTAPPSMQRAVTESIFLAVSWTQQSGLAPLTADFVRPENRAFAEEIRKSAGPAVAGSTACLY
jgi:hypothetical protein